MKRGQSYIRISSEENPNHPIIKALTEKGIGKAEVLYASMYSTHAGWEMISSDHGHAWLGFTKKEALWSIKKLIFKYGQLRHED